jgi:malate dehydrogenase (oxaloacetate-decarboxylating)(NADP+)
MFMAAARTLAAQVTPDDLNQGSLYPPLKQIRNVSAHIAAAVAEVAHRQGFARVPQPPDLLAFMNAQMYQPGYVPFAT